jgi:hypothetical protein
MGNELTPVAFLYNRMGPWPQPSSSHPLLEAPEVLNIPPVEEMQWNATIGLRYAETLAGWPPAAAEYAIENSSYTAPNDERFNTILFETVYTRFLLPPDDDEVSLFISLFKGQPWFSEKLKWWKYDFRAMELVEPIPGCYCAPTVLVIAEEPSGSRTCRAIQINQLTILPHHPAWTAAKIFALQGAAYHILFVVHPALHFPMDSVNAITKTAVPMTHPLFQAIYPHTTYTLPLDNAVLESPISVVNNNAATWFDPLTADAYNLKLLFGAGYAGLPKYPKSYPKYDYMKPQYGFDSDYGRWLKAYFDVFESFALEIAKRIFALKPTDSYVERWVNYLHTYIYGFPSAQEVMGNAEVLARILAIYMWDVSVAHGADHWSFGTQVEVREKFLRIRIKPPTSIDEPPPQPGSVATIEDLYRASITQQMFFLPFAITPNLYEVRYAFLDPALYKSQFAFKNNLVAVSTQSGLKQYQPLQPDDKKVPKVPYERTIPSSIQY